jgi:hypothetical protein
MTRKSRVVLTVAGIITSAFFGSICILSTPFSGLDVIRGWLPSMIIVGAILGFASSYLKRSGWFPFFIPPLGWITGLILGGIAYSTGILSDGQQFIAIPFFGLLAGLVIWLVVDFLESTIHTKGDIGQ